jgi:hypothetical protein
MLDTLTHLNATDFKARYSGTFGWYIDDESKSKTLVYVSRVDSKGVEFRDSFGRGLYAKADSGIMFEFIPVDRQWVLKDDHSLWFTVRHPARMWKRGVCLENTQVFAGGAGGIVPVNPDRDVFFTVLAANTTPRLAEINYQRFMDGEADTVWLSKHFVILKNDVYFFNKQIGTYKKGVISLDSDLLQQEVNDLVRRQNYKLSVKVV